MCKSADATAIHGREVMRQGGPDNIDYEEPDDDVHIDVCMSCGRYYGHTQGLSDYWHEHYKPRQDEVMPQLCFKCLENGK